MLIQTNWTTFISFLWNTQPNQNCVELYMRMIIQESDYSKDHPSESNMDESPKSRPNSLRWFTVNVIELAIFLLALLEVVSRRQIIAKCAFIKAWIIEFISISKPFQR